MEENKTDETHCHLLIIVVVIVCLKMMVVGEKKKKKCCVCDVLCFVLFGSALSSYFLCLALHLIDKLAVVDRLALGSILDHLLDLKKKKKKKKKKKRSGKRKGTDEESHLLRTG